MFGRDQTGKDLDPAALDREIMVAAPERLTPIFEHPQPATLRPVVRRQFLKPDHAMGDAVNGLVHCIRRQVVKHQDRGGIAREEVFERQDLAAVTERSLSEQPDFGQAVEHDPRRLDTLDGLEDHPGGFAQFQVGGVQKALLLVRVQQAFRRRQFEHLDPIAKRPPMGGGALREAPSRFPTA